jgi:hypothetical protein
MAHLQNNKLLSEEQFGFRPKRSCTSQLLTTCDSWSQSIEEGDNIDVIFLDYRKAFDTVPHKRLAAKLEAYGVQGPLKQWIEDFLSDRVQRVVVAGECSEWADVTSGMPQGSVLGPVLFVIYINDLPENVSCQTKMFADDTKLFGVANGPQDHQQMQQSISSVCGWSHTWQLGFNVGKCKAMHIGKSNPNTQYVMEGNPLTTVEEETDLGVTIDKGLTFAAHVAKKVSKANQILGLIRRTFRWLDKDAFLYLYKAKVSPHLEYATTAWSMSRKHEARLIIGVQR